MKVLVTLRDSLTGFTKECIDSWPDGYSVEGLELWWLEGNGSCDCNRSLKLYGEVGKLPCSPGKSQIELVKLVIVVYDEKDAIANLPPASIIGCL